MKAVAELGLKLRVGRQNFFAAQHMNCELIIENQELNKNISQTYNVSKRILESTSCSYR
jgi:hypothetical protein